VHFFDEDIDLTMLWVFFDDNVASFSEEADDSPSELEDAGCFFFFLVVLAVLFERAFFVR